MFNKRRPTMIVLTDVTRSFSASSGPGGQNVNKRATKATLCFDIEACRRFSQEQKLLMKERAPQRYLVGKRIICVTSQETRSQKENERRALKKLNTIITRALTPRKKRKTTVPQSVQRRIHRERRLLKERRRERKATRRNVL